MGQPTEAGLASIEPEGIYEHLAVGDLEEGYTLAYMTGAVDNVKWDVYGSNSGINCISSDICQDTEEEFVSYPSLKGLGFALTLPIPSASEQCGTLTDARLAMLPAAITSASPAKLHDVQINEDCVLRLALSIHPHFGHVRLVLRGSTRCTGTPDN